ncbi:MAG: DUF2723 domain-containing protein [bacterium]
MPPDTHATPAVARRDGWISLALAVAAFALYASGACRTIYVGDSGELVAAVHTLGIPHPPGYPLYVLLGKLWTLALPLGSIAFRMSLFSAVCGALAVAGVYRVARALGVRAGVAVVAAITLAAAPSFWAEANVQRVYTLEAVFLALATGLGVRWLEAGEAAVTPRARDRWLVAAAFVAALGTGSHLFLGVWLLVFLVVAFASDPGLVRRGRALFATLLAALAGCSIYAYLPLRSRAEPRLDWGDPETLDRFVAVVTRRGFWERRWWSGWVDAIPIARDFGASVAHELTIVGALLALIGIVSARRATRRPVLLLALVVLANVGALAAHGSRSDLFLWHRYYIPAYLSLTLLAAVGLERVVAALATRSSRAARAMVTSAAIGALALVPLRFRDFDRSRYRLAEDYSRRLLASLPPGAHLAASDDNILFVLVYLKLVEGVRPDIDLVLEGVGSELPPLRFDPDDESLFFTHHPNWHVPAIDVVPAGLAYRVVRAGAQPLPVALPEPPLLAGEDDERVPKDYLTQNLIGEFHFMRGVTLEAHDPERALMELAAAARAAPSNDVLFYNLGLVYERMGRDDLALAAFERSAAINPRPILGPARVRAVDRIDELRRRLGP